MLLRKRRRAMCVIAFGAILFIALLFTPQAWHQQSYAQPRQANRQPSKQQANTQPANTPVNQGPTQINNDSEATRRREQQERDAKETAFKVEQLRQNRIIVWATVAIAFFGFLTLIASFIYAIVSNRQLRSIKEQAKHAGEQVEILKTQSDTLRDQANVMGGQLEAMKEQAKIMRESLAQSQKQIEHMTVIDRAYIEIVEVRMGALKVDSQNIIKTAFLNIGRTPAWNFRSKSVLIFIEKPQPLQSQWHENLAPRGKGKVLPAGKEIVQESYPNLIFTREQVHALVNKTAKLYDAGVLEYIDITGTIQNSRYVRIYDPETGTFNEYEQAESGDTD